VETKVDRSIVRTISVIWITKLKENEVKENFWSSISKRGNKMEHTYKRGAYGIRGTGKDTE
jgi:hypothetical protein